jgi:hypothetical protein
MNNYKAEIAQLPEDTVVTHFDDGFTTTVDEAEVTFQETIGWHIKYFDNCALGETYEEATQNLEELLSFPPDDYDFLWFI